MEGKAVRALPEEEDDDEGEGGSDYQDGVQQARKDLENFSDDPEEEDDQDIEWTANNISHPISKATLPTSSSSKPHHHPPASNPQEETPTFIIPVSEPEETASLDLLGHHHHGSTALLTESEKTDTVPRVDDDPTQLQIENERNVTAATAVPGTQIEHAAAAAESSTSAEQRIKQLEEKVEKLNALRLVDAASISCSFSYPLSKFSFFILIMYTSHTYICM